MSKTVVSFHQRRRPKGISLVEMLVATAIIGVALIGMVSSWVYVVHAAIVSDNRSAAYEVARMVLERARANGGAINQQFPGGQPVMISTPVSGNSRTTGTGWISPMLLHYRFYDAKLEELEGGTNADLAPDPPRNAAFRVTTTYAVSSDATRPAGRDDLRLVTLTVVVHKVNNDGTVETDPLTRLQTCLTQGGLL